jgi:hypothetical protein
MSYYHCTPYFPKTGEAPKQLVAGASSISPRLFTISPAVSGRGRVSKEYCSHGTKSSHKMYVTTRSQYWPESQCSWSSLRTRTAVNFFKVNTTYLVKMTRKRGDEARAASSHSTQSTNPLHEHMRSGMQVDPPSHGRVCIPQSSHCSVIASFSSQSVIKSGL